MGVPSLATARKEVAKLELLVNVLLIPNQGTSKKTLYQELSMSLATQGCFTWCGQMCDCSLIHAVYSVGWLGHWGPGKIMTGKLVRKVSREEICG